MTGRGMEQAKRLLGMTGQDMSALVVPEGTPLRVKKTAKTLAPGADAETLRDTARRANCGLRLGPASAFAGKDRAVLLKIFWDGEKEPAVPLSGRRLLRLLLGRPAARSLLVGTEGGDELCLFPYAVRPLGAHRTGFREERGGAAGELGRGDSHADLPRRKDEGGSMRSGGAKPRRRRASRSTSWRLRDGGIWSG